MEQDELDQVIELSKAGVHLSALTVAATLLALYGVGLIWSAAWWLMPAMAAYWVVTRLWKLGAYRKQAAALLEASKRRGEESDAKLDAIARKFNGEAR